MELHAADDIFIEAVATRPPTRSAAAFSTVRVRATPRSAAKFERLLDVRAAAEDFLKIAPWSSVRPPPSTSPRRTPRHAHRPLQAAASKSAKAAWASSIWPSRQQPVERRVALKIIKPGMDSRQVIARFEAERQALAMMDHPNIAKVLDAGTTETGRPYFVMELVKGIPITKYCDEKRLSLRERLELMIPVCQAIQHAHQKGIIHRDIKPTNVLVAQYDGKPVPKVIDFGVAKATAQKLTERTHVHRARPDRRHAANTCRPSRPS